MAHVILLLLAGTQHVPQNLRSEPQHALAEQIPSHPRQRVALDLVYFSSRMCSLTIELSEGKLIAYRPSLLSRHRRLLAIGPVCCYCSIDFSYQYSNGQYVSCPRFDSHGARQRPDTTLAY